MRCNDRDCDDGQLVKNQRRTSKGPKYGRRGTGNVANPHLGPFLRLSSMPR